ncbi:hypothetical protein OIU76_004858 [Salix suchowensis]|nr:hypothetical protein OIU76_004858 [Salix suchowensis]
MTLLKKKTVKKLRKRITKMQRMDGGMDETTTMMKRQRMKTRAPWYPLGFVFVMVLKINAKMSTCIFYWAILSKALSLYSPNRSHLLNFCPPPLFFPKAFYPNRRSHTSIRWFWSGSIVTVMGGRLPNPAFLKSDKQNLCKII